MYGVVIGSAANWPIVGQIAWLLGKFMDAIYNVMNGVFGIQNIGLCIIIFTIIIYTLMIPLTIKQQKFSKMSSVMNPEIQKIQKKYAGKKDQASMMKQQEEMQLVYEKYGTSPTGGCLPLLIQMPVLFALYPVIQNIPNYVEGVKNTYMPLVNEIMATNGFQKIMETIGEAKPILMNASNYDYSVADTLVNVLYKFQDATWGTLIDQIPSVEQTALAVKNTISSMNMFLGINIAEAPLTMFMDNVKSFSIVGIIIAALIPVLAGLTQFLSVKLQPQPAADPENQMAQSMKTMTYTMPLFSVFLCFTMPAGIGIYWCASAMVRCIQQVAINKYLSTMPVDDLIKKNQEKAAKKREKKGTNADKLSKMATTSTRNVTEKKSSIPDKEKEAKIQKAAEVTQNAKPGSLASKANLVRSYNNSNHNKKDKEQ